jgi:hypothetical protein
MWFAWVSLLVMGVASAQTAASEDEAAEEVVVWGEHHVRQARAVVVRSLEDLGWRARSKSRDGMVVFRPPEAWMGKAFFTAEGQLEFGRPVIAVTPTLVPGTYAVYDPDEVLDRRDTAGIAAGPRMTILPAEKRILAIQNQVREAVREPVEAYVALYRETEFRTLLEQIPARLDRLWEEGRPVDGGEGSVETPRDRRLAVLAYWSSQPDNEDGLAVSERVEAWLRETVQRSESPLKMEEIAAAEAMRVDGRSMSKRVLQPE